MMVKKMNEGKVTVECEDRFCPVHGDKPLKIRGKLFYGTVIRKTDRKVVVQFERMLRIKKYERYEKRKTKLHCRLPDCLKEKVHEGDYVEVGETRPVSKMIHSVVIKLIKSMNEENESDK